MDQGARKKARATLVALRRERNEAAEWYGDSSTAPRIVGAGQGRFVKSYEVLRQSFAKARKEL